MRDHTVNINPEQDCPLNHHRATCRDCGWTSYCGNLTYVTEAGLQHRDNLPAIAVPTMDSEGVCQHGHLDGWCCLICRPVNLSGEDAASLAVRS